jgi:hypothetical protein
MRLPACDASPDPARLTSSEATLRRLHHWIVASIALRHRDFGHVTLGACGHPNIIHGKNRASPQPFGRRARLTAWARIVSTLHDFLRWNARLKDLRQSRQRTQKHVSRPITEPMPQSGLRGGSDGAECVLPPGHRQSPCSNVEQP